MHRIQASRHTYFFCLLMIFAAALFLRAYRISEIPDIVHIDEAGLARNAWCLANYGVDRYFNEMPVYPENFGGGQSPLYSYLVVLLVKTIGKGSLSLTLLRLPGLFSSMLVVLFGTGLVSSVYENRKVTLTGALLLTFCPYFIMHGRYALDCNLMLGCSTAALYLLARYVRTGRLSYLIAYSVAFGIVMYSYALSYFVVPIFLCLITLYLLWCRRITFRRALLSALCVCITALPILLFVCTLLFGLPPIHFLGFTLSPTAASRLSDISLSNFRNNVIDIIKCTLTHDGRPLDAVDGFYTMYAVSIPFILIGFAASCYQWLRDFKSRTCRHGFLFFSFYIAGLIAIGLSHGYLYRANYLFISYLYFLICGIISACRFVRSLRTYFMAGLSLVYLFCAVMFIRYYFTSYSPAETIPQFVPANEAVEYAGSRPDIRDIYLDYAGVSEFYTAFFPESPYTVAETTHEDGYGRMHFSITTDTVLLPGNAYIVLKNNQAILTYLNDSGYDWHIEEYPCHYLFY
ncbi:MAG: glycosyltransferase family 39 protein [Lachnospiraceae bacterium]|nr:glycosyltransferase family 39 protein [uncultured Acetatifactor sp.]MCI8542778.1 glycosyltransferase family 39 protein [Lachnospiraceae bacterium]